MCVYYRHRYFMKNICELSVIYAPDICHVISSTNDAISFHSHNTHRHYVRNLLILLKEHAMQCNITERMSGCILSF